MHTKRIVAVVSLALGIGVGAGAGPALNMVGVASAAKTYHYVCVRPSFIAGSVYLVNLSNKEAAVTLDDGTTTDPFEFTIQPNTGVAHNFNAGGGQIGVFIKSNRKLLADGSVTYANSHGDQPTWQIRCN